MSGKKYMDKVTLWILKLQYLDGTADKTVSHSAYEDGQFTSIYGQSEHHIFLDITLWLDQ